MAVYYVDFVNGLDANNGLGPDASAASNKPWKTIAKLLGASGMASGDTAYLSPAGPFREVVTVAMTSAVAETQILGDPGNAQGFKTSGGVLVDPGLVRWTAYLTNETTNPSTTAGLLTLAGRDFLTFQGITFVGCNQTPMCVNAQTANSTNITFRECVFLPPVATSFYHIDYTGTANAAANWLIDRCVIFGGTAAAIHITLPTSASADWDAAFTIQNTLFDGSSTGVRVDSSGALAFKAGGVNLLNCTAAISGSVINCVGTSLSTTIPCTVYSSVIYTSSTGLTAGASGQVLEDYNLIVAVTARSNVTAGTHSQVAPTYALAMEVGQSQLHGFQPRMFGMPLAGSPLLGFGNQAGGPAVDLLNRARPSGGGSTSNAIGALERHDTAAKETGTTDAGSVGLVITGPGDQDLAVAVDAAAATISIRARYDSSHAATNKPQVLLLANGEIGVVAQTLTMTAAVDTWETLTTASFTPTRAGVVKIRLVSRSAAGGGKAFFDTAVIT